MEPLRPEDTPPAQFDNVDALAAQFLAQLQAGENPDRQALVRDHPDIASLLERRLVLAEMAYRVGLAPQSDPSGAETVRATISGSNPSASQTPTIAASAQAQGRCRLPEIPDYELLGVLGRGGMGVVYQARQISLNRIVALKMISAGAHAGAEVLARFHIEAEALASLQHPNIVQVYEVGEHEGCPYMAMEFLDGGSLDRCLAGRAQPPRAAAELLEILARAMHCAHQRGIVHRDLKPANILLKDEGGRMKDEKERQALANSSFILHPSSFIPKISDFGLAKRLQEDAGRTQSGAILGTPSYMAPEQAAGRRQAIGPGTDVYALGAVLYEMLTGRPPFRGETPLDTVQQVNTGEPVPPSRLGYRVPRDLDTICVKCLEKEPAKRYATAEALADDLRRFLDQEPIAARPAALGERAWKWAKRRPAWAALISVVVVAAMALAASFGWSYARVRGERNRVRASFQVARRAVDDLYTKMATERLFDEPQLDPLCQELLEKARELYEDLAHNHSDDPALRRDTALAWFRLGEIYRMRERRDQAEQSYTEAIRRQGQLCRDVPGEPRCRQDLANSHNWLGELLREWGRPADEVERHYRIALELQQGLVEAFPDEPAYRLELARSHYNLGIVERDTDRLPEARADYDRAVALLSDLHRTNPGEPNCRQDLARAFINRGILHRLSERLGESGEDYDRAIELLSRLNEEFPFRSAYKYELAIGRQDRGNLFWNQRRHVEAQREQRAALGLLQGLVADFSTRPRYQKKKANVLNNLGSALASAGDLRGAERCWKEARDLIQALVAEFPDTPDYQALFSMILGNTAWLRTEQKNWQEARRLIELGMEQMQKALRPNPRRPDYLLELSSQYQDLSETCVQLGDHAAAVQAAKKLAGIFPDRSQTAYYGACFVARSIPLALADNRIDDPARRAAAGEYAAQAVALLKQSVHNAGPDLKRLKEEKQVFQPLESHPELGALLRELDARTHPVPGKGGP